ncbi:MAG: shikimate dehydrogenase [Gammaproteobacteria bacterium]
MLRYAVIGDPIKHSLSPTIHTAFAGQLGIELQYDRIQVSLESFADDVNEFFAAGGLGLNVTMPLKTLAFEYADITTDSALSAGAANTLQFLSNDVVLAATTDGTGLVQDLHYHNVELTNKRVLLLGAGGAARSCVGALLHEKPEALFIYNRTQATAQALIKHAERQGTIHLLDDSNPAEPFDVVINATSASLGGARPDINHRLLKGAVCYDMMYGDNAAPFTKWALASGALAAHDGMGMLIEQAAASFLLWHDVLPDTGPVRELLSAQQTVRR